ncbi:uncharacterized protein LOC117176314 [Belonocnema kinseyi]|uniref:uncharacterized protein LOC117176314 n=1 Tax=Belonocnema kinseyi TaxID=2817044 RepID=UPI00143DC0E7|nr:uncharacterized protein LOC117176314 [Belonocnema kinseyi]
MRIHIRCGQLYLNTEGRFVCSFCIRGKYLLDTQEDGFKRLQVEATKMKTFSDENCAPVNVGDSIRLFVPAVDRGLLDFSNIFRIVTRLENSVYQIGTKDGLLKGWFPRTEIQISKTSVIELTDIHKVGVLSLQEAATKQSVSGGQCCPWFKAGILCNSRCHKSSPCCNK